VALLGISACSHDPSRPAPRIAPAPPAHVKAMNAARCIDSGVVASGFVSDWVRHPSDDSSQIAHLTRDSRVAPELALAHKSMLEQARQSDPELGLGFDPILDAQDNPDSGFRTTGVDSAGYAMVAGPDGFLVTLRLELRHGHCRITGAGRIGIPVHKQAPR
jgi:hypothetical protein